MRAPWAKAAWLLQLEARHPKMATFAPDGEFAPVATPYRAEISTTPTLFDLTGKTALVTGGNGGIGSGIARGLAEAGADIIIIQIPGEKSLFPERLAADTGRRVDTYDCDLASSEAIRSTVDRILVRDVRTVDILANVAGISGGFVPILTETDAHRELVRILSSSITRWNAKHRRSSKSTTTRYTRFRSSYHGTSQREVQGAKSSTSHPSPQTRP